MDGKKLSNLQETEFGMLADLDVYCKKYKIKYSLYAGTMLGAVRHKGFIPWDDDVDICMTRSEYTKFCNTISLHPMEGYYFQSFETDSNCMMNHGKLRKDGTVLLSKGENENIGHHGVWIDIFPLDKISRKKTKAIKTLWIGKAIIYLTRANQRIVFQDKKKFLVNRMIRIIPSTIRQYVLRRLVRKLREYDKTTLDNYEWISMSAVYSLKYRFPNNILSDYTALNFNTKEFMVFKDYKKMLSILYGDYMVLPPESERVCRHNPIKIVL